MSEDANQKVVGRYIEEFKNKGNHAIVRELLAPEVRTHLKLQGVPPTREGLEMLGKGVVAAFPDVHATVEELLATGDKVIERTSAGGTSRGPFNGIPPNGKPVRWTEIHIYRLHDGKIVEHWGEIDLMAILAQLGALPAPG